MSDQDNEPINYDLPVFISAMEKRRVQLFERGDWYHHTNDKFAAHYFIMAREDSDLAISMCASIVTPIDTLHAPQPGARCLTCALYEQVGKGGEYQEKQARRKQHAERVLKLHEARKAAKEAAKHSKTTTGE